MQSQKDEVYQLRLTSTHKLYQLRLTSEQQEEVRELTGKKAETLLLTVEELEERIAPRLATN
jgi:hypothetical protein